MIDLAAMPLNEAPTGFGFARTGSGGQGKWAVVADATAPGGRALAQNDPDRTDYRFPLAILDAPVARNLEVSLTFRAVAGKVDRAGGIALRLASADNYYVVRANALEDNVRFYRVVKGKRQQLAGADVKVASDVWHALTLRAEGDRFTIGFDGKTLYTATDKTFADAGRVALWTKADSITHFGDIRVTTLP